MPFIYFVYSAAFSVNSIELLPVTIKWNLEGLACISLCVNQSIEMLPSATSLWMVTKCTCHTLHPTLGPASNCKLVN